MLSATAVKYLLESLPGKAHWGWDIELICKKTMFALNLPAVLIGFISILQESSPILQPRLEASQTYYTLP
jgi:hypothetical protein